MILRCIQPPIYEPVNLSDVEGQCRIADLSYEASTVDRFITACRQRCETITKRALITQQWELLLDAFPINREKLELPFPPLQTVDSIIYTDQDGVEQTLADTAYRVITGSSETCQPGYVIPVYGSVWPIALNDFATVTVKFTCGYGPLEANGSSNVPKAIEQWILLNVSDMYENRETIQLGNRLTMIETTIADGLIEDYRVYGPF